MVICFQDVIHGHLFDQVDKTIPMLAEEIGITERSIERNLQKLQKEQVLKRVGGAKGGFWEIAE